MPVFTQNYSSTLVESFLFAKQSASVINFSMRKKHRDKQLI